tara:strand:- start:1039 stop:1257 length:219 start_codon:yes stop_codon:yes gene_type:complete
MASKKKPTMNEVRNVINNILIDLSHFRNAISRLDGVISSYIDFNGNKEEWVKFVESKIEKDKKEDNKDDNKS